MKELEFRCPSAHATRCLGRALAKHLHAGDLVVLSGPLGAGKTTLTQGIGAGLRVSQRVTSPTFIIARTHESPTPDLAPGMVHVDAYRLGGVEDIEALDLETALSEHVVVVEWGENLVEYLSEHVLLLRLERQAPALDSAQNPGEDPVGEAPTQIQIQALKGEWNLESLVTQWEALCREQEDSW